MSEFCSERDPATELPDTMPVLRWQCPQCSRFIGQNNIREEDYLDPGAYYGVGTRTWIDCSRCGTLEREPLLVTVGEIPFPEGLL